MLSFRKPSLADMKVYFDWANDFDVRMQSYNSNLIELDNHKRWFENVLKDEKYFMYIFQNADNENIGQVRIQKINDNEVIIGISVASQHRGNGYAKEMLLLSTDSFISVNNKFIINAYIKETNLSSKYSFEKAGFEFSDMVYYEGFLSFHYIKTAKK